MRLSVIIPVHDGAAMLERCLQGLLRSSFRDYECIVVDDASTEDTRGVATRFPVTFAALERRGGPARARNHGAARARGEILVFIDSDVGVHADTLERLDQHLARDASAAAVFGSYDDQPADPHFVSQYKNLLHHFVHQRSRTDAWTFWAGCGAIRREAFRRVGGFDESYARPSVEDIDLGLRLRAHGQRIDLDPGIQVTHLKRWTVSGLVRADLFHRAIPWMRLMLRHRTMPSDLNVTVRDRASVALVWTMALAALAIGITRTHVLLGATLLVLCAVGLCGLNRDLYRFLARKRGLAFAARALALHWFYFLYCGLAVPMALFAHARDVALPHESPPASVRE
jgi:GT2 family glycosyltransferase